METTIVVAGHRHTVVMEQDGSAWHATVDGVSFRIKVDRRGTQAAVDAGGHVHVIDLQDAHTALIDGIPVAFRIEGLKGVAGAQDPGAGRHGPIKPPMTGRLEQVLVAEGDTVARGDVLFVLEAMKMRNEIKAPSDGVIGKVHAKPGDAVDPSAPILDLLAPDE